MPRPLRPRIKKPRKSASINKRPLGEAVGGNLIGDDCTLEPQASSTPTKEDRKRSLGLSTRLSLSPIIYSENETIDGEHEASSPDSLLKRGGSVPETVELEKMLPRRKGHDLVDVFDSSEQEDDEHILRRRRRRGKRKRDKENLEPGEDGEQAKAVRRAFEQVDAWKLDEEMVSTTPEV